MPIPSNVLSGMILPAATLNALFEYLRSELKVPTGSTADRPAFPTVGQIYLNTTLGFLEAWDGTDWRLQQRQWNLIEHGSVDVVTTLDNRLYTTGISIPADDVFFVEAALGSFVSSLFTILRSTLISRVVAVNGDSGGSMRSIRIALTSTELLLIGRTSDNMFLVGGSSFGGSDISDIMPFRVFVHG